MRVLVLLLTYFDEKEGDPICIERAAELDIVKLGVDLAETVELTILSKNVLFNSLDLGVLPRQEFGEI